MSKTGAVSSPRVGYATFCGNDPTDPTNVGKNEGSSGGFATGCLGSGGADGTSKGKDYDPSWPIESPDDLPQEPDDPPPVIDPCHDHDPRGAAHAHANCACEPTARNNWCGEGPPKDPDDKPKCCDCEAENNTCDPQEIKCCGGMFGISHSNLLLMMIVSAALSMM